MAIRRSDKIVFYKKTITEAANESLSESWALDFARWAEADRQSEVSARFTILYQPNIGTGTHRIIWDGCIWEITAATHDRRRKNLFLTCDFSALEEVTHLGSTEREFISGLPLVRPPEEEDE